MLMKNPRTGRLRSAVGGAVATVAVVAVVATAGVVGFKLIDNPFTTEIADRSVPPVLLQLRDLSEFHAAQAQFEVTIDLEDDVKWVPSFIAGERVQFVGVGTVDAVVDFSDINAGSIVVDEDTSTVTVTLGRVQVQDPVLDLELSHVMNRDRGIINRVSGMFTDNPTSEAQLYQVAEDKIAEAAAATELSKRAETNITNTLTAMISALGYEHVVVRFQVWSAGPG